VRGVRRRSFGQAVVLWFGSFFGVGRAEPAAAAVASMDQRICGFRPLDYVAIPMVPLLVSAALPWPPATSTAPGAWPDNYSVAPRTGAVSSGPDGIGEITLVTPFTAGALPPGQTASQWLWLTAGAADFAWLAEQVRVGLEPIDLVAQGGQLALAPDGTLRLPLADLPTVPQADLLQTALEAIRGQKRIWPVGNVIAIGGDPPACLVTGFVGGTVVDCHRDVGAITIVVQACSVQTCTGLLRGTTVRSPWIGKLILHQSK
jgi:hypothetical protein